MVVATVLCRRKSWELESVFVAVLWFKKKISFYKIWLDVAVGFRYVFSKNCGWSLCVTKNIYKMFGGSVIVIVFQSIFYLEMH